MDGITKILDDDLRAPPIGKLLDKADIELSIRRQHDQLLANICRSNLRNFLRKLGLKSCRFASKADTDYINIPGRY